MLPGNIDRLDDRTEVIKAPLREIKPPCACQGEKKVYQSPNLRMLDDSDLDLRLKSKLKETARTLQLSGK
jgi:hypothetical protein